MHRNTKSTKVKSKSHHEISHLSCHIYHLLCVLGLVCFFTSCHWHEAKNVIATADRLRPLSEVKAFIEENKHLPEIKSAQEMQENGVGINELQTQLLQKIEELTLYILQQEERIKVLEELLMH